MSEPKRYEIDSFERLLNVINEENFDNLTTDLVIWLHYYVNYVKSLRNQYPEETKHLSNFQLLEGQFEWIDDGNNELNEVKLINRQTGEVIISKRENK